MDASTNLGTDIYEEMDDLNIEHDVAENVFQEQSKVGDTKQQSEHEIIKNKVSSSNNNSEVKFDGGKLYNPSYLYVSFIIN